MEVIKGVLKNRYSSQRDFQEIISQIMNDSDVRDFVTQYQKVLTDDIIKNSYSQFLEYIDEKKRVSETGYSSNRGFVPKLKFCQTYVEVAYVPTDAFLKKQARQKIKDRIQTLEMPEDIKNYTFEDVEGTKERLEAFAYLVDFCDAEDSTDKKGAYLYGSYGVGKTYLFGALASELAQKGVSSYLAHFPSLVVSLKSAIADNSVVQKINFIKESQVLLLDDIGGESLTPWVRDDILMVILDYRMRYNLPTFFTSNLTFEQLEEHFKGTTIEDERKAKRLMERVRALSVPIRVGGENRRK